MSTAPVAGLVALLVGIGLTVRVWRIPVDVLRPATARRFGSLPLPALDAGDDAVVCRRLGWQRRLASLATGPALLCFVEFLIAATHGESVTPRPAVWFGLMLTAGVLPRLLDPAVARRIRSHRSTAPLRRRTLRSRMSPWLLVSQGLVCVTALLWSVSLLRQQHDGDTIACVAVEATLLCACWFAQVAILRAPAGMGTPPGLVWGEFLRSSALTEVAGSLAISALLPIIVGANHHVVQILMVISMLGVLLSRAGDSDDEQLRRVYAMLAGPVPDHAPRGQEAG